MNNNKSIGPNCIIQILLILAFIVALPILAISMVFESLFRDITKTGYVPKETSNPIVQVELYDEFKDSTLYGIIYSDEGCVYIDGYLPGTNAVVYDCTYCFEPEIVDNEIKIHFRNNEIVSNGKTVESKDSLTDIMSAVAKITEHDIFISRIFEIEGHYYVFIELNVNWCAPADLYAYDPDTRSLIHLYTWDSVQVTGMKSLENKAINPN